MNLKSFYLNPKATNELFRTLSATNLSMGTTNLLFAQHWYAGEGPGIGTVLWHLSSILIWTNAGCTKSS